MGSLLRKKFDLLMASLSKKRKYYCEVEYLENIASTSSGSNYPATQYIDTGIKPAGTVISGKVKYSYTGAEGAPTRIITEAIVGGTTTDNTANLRIGTLLGKYRIKWNNVNDTNNGVSYTGTTALTTGTIFEDEFNTATGFYSNGTQLESKSSLTSVAGCTNNIMLFTDVTSGSGLGYNSSGKRLYYCKLYQDGVLVRDFIPVLDWNYVPCLYDKVSGQLFYNQGTDEFLHGREIHEVEYIESTGTQYIDTGVSTNDVTSTYCKFAGTFGLTYSGKTYSGQCFGSRISTTNNAFYYANGVNNDSIGNGSDIISITRNANTTFSEIAYSKTNYEVTGTSYSQTGSLNVGSITSNFNFYLFGINDNGSANLGTWKYSSFKLYTSSGLTRDFIPIVDENFNGYLFDKVNRKIYENAGTGSFVVPDIEVEYIESTGTQYIDTGYIQTQNTELSVDCAFTDLSNGRFGSVKLAGSNTYRFYFGVLDNKWIGAVNNINPNHNIATADYNRHQFDLSTTGLYIDGELKVAPSNSYPLATITLFNLYTTSISTIAKAKLYSCTIGESGVLVKNYIPVIHNGVACLKDTLNNTYLTNAGTNAFLAGKIVEKA